MNFVCHFDHVIKGIGVGIEIDHLTDIWACGVLLHRLICGRHPLAPRAPGCRIWRRRHARPPHTHLAPTLCLAADVAWSSPSALAHRHCTPLTPHPLPHPLPRSWRGLEFTKRFYAPKRFIREAGHQKPPKLSEAYGGWVPEVIHMSEADVIRCAGVDAAVYIKILRFGGCGECMGECMRVRA